MRTISYKLDDLKKAIIRIGYVGENQHTQVRIDCKDLFKEYPDAAVSAAIVSPAGQSYPKVVTVDGPTVVWDVTDSDLAAEGDGEIQLTFTEGGVVAKTAVARFNVYRSITADGPAPDPVDDWLQEASEALEDIEAAEVNQPIIGQDGYWYTWDQEAGKYVKTNTKAQGEDGQPGHTPEKGVDYWTAADKAEMESDVAGAIIDDTSTALDKTWSASKSNTLLNAITLIKNDTDSIKETLGLDGEVIDYGTDFPLEITAEEGETVNLTFDTAQSYFVTNKNLFTQSSVTFENNRKYSLPFRLPAGTYTLSALVTTTDTDATYSNFIIYDGTTAIVTYYLERDVRKAKTFTIAVPFDTILFYASDSYSHSSGDTATWSNIQLEANGSATEFVAPNGFVESVAESNSITIEETPTYIYSNDFSDISGYGISGAIPVITPMQKAIKKHNDFFADNDFEGNQGDKYNVLQVPYALTDVVDNAFISSNGSILTGSSYSVYMVSPLIPVQKSGLYGIKVSKESNNVGNLINSVNGFCFYGQDGTTAIGRTASDLTNISGDIYTLNVPEGTAFVRFTIYKVAASTQERTLTQFNQWIFLPNATSAIDESFFILSVPKETGYTDRLLRSDGSYIQLCSTELLNKKILVFGDSIWGNDRTDGVADFLSKYSGVTIYNCSIGGTWICGDRSDYSGGAAWRAFDGVNLINAKLTDTWTDQDTYKDDVAAYAPEVLALLKSVDMTKIDIVVLSYGTNDFSNNKTIAAIKSAYETVIGAILTAYPKIRILICTPAWRMFSGTDGDTYQNSNNETTRQMADGIVEMAESNHVESLNMFTSLPWRALTKAYYLDSDEVHPNTEGNKVYAHVVHGKLRSMY